MTDEQINKRIHEIMGLCWHYWTFTGPKQGTFKCTKCGEFRNNPSSNFNFTGDWKTSAYEFGLLWEFLRKHTNGDTWKDFWSVQYGKRGRDEPESWVLKLISPPALSRAVVDFFEASHD